MQRWVKFAKYLRQYGWEPVIFTVENGEYPVLDDSLIKEVPEDIEVIRQPIFEPFTWYKRFTGKDADKRVQLGVMAAARKGNWKERLALWIRSNVFIPDARMFWIRPATTFLKEYLAEHPVDALVTTGPPHSAHLIGLRLKEALGLPWLADFRDPWTKIYYFDDLTLTAWAKKQHERLEKAVLHAADQVVVVGRGMQHDFQADHDIRAAVVTNGFDRSDFKEMAPASRTDAFTLVHTGSLLSIYQLQGLWQAIHRQREKGGLKRLEIHFYGKVEGGVMEEIARYNFADKVTLHGYVSHQEVTAIQQRAGILLLALEIKTPVLTGKFFEYLGSGRPVLAIGSSVSNFEVKGIVEETQCGAFLETDDNSGIEQYLVDSYRQFESGSPLGNSRADITAYTREALTGKMAGLLDALRKAP